MRLQPGLKLVPGGDVGDLLVADGACAPGSKAGGFLNEFASAEVIAAGKAAPASSARPLRIAHVLSSVSPDTGGPATVVARIAAAQAARGHRVSIISSLSPETRP